MKRVLIIVALVTAGACRTSNRDQAGPVTQIDVAGASDLGAKWKLKSKITPVFQFGSSGLLARQIKQGAPIDLYAAANVQYIDDVIASGTCDGATRAMYARGRLVLWSKDGGVAPPTKLEDLTDPRFKTIAIASPDHAPYGMAAKQALEKLGIWSAVQGRIKYGEDIRKTLQFAETGNVDVAIVALSLSIVTKGGTAVAVPPELHDPIDQALVVCGTGPRAAAARQFPDYISSPEGRAVMMNYGFILPGETGP